jgi:hypothetical protein
MNKNFVTLISLLSLTLVVPAQDAKHSHEKGLTVAQHGQAPGHGANFQPEFENESVQVVRIKIGPHEKIPMHDLTPRVVVLLTDQDLKLTFPNGATREERHAAGETMWLSAQRHAGENLTTNQSNSLP